MNHPGFLVGPKPDDKCHRRDREKGRQRKIIWPKKWPRGRLAKDLSKRRGQNHHSRKLQKNRFSPEPAENLWPCQHTDFGLLESRAVRSEFLLFQPQFVVLCHSNRGKPIQVGSENLLILNWYQKLLVGTPHEHLKNCG